MIGYSQDGYFVAQAFIAPLHDDPKVLRQIRADQTQITQQEYEFQERISSKHISKYNNTGLQ